MSRYPITTVQKLKKAIYTYQGGLVFIITSMLVIGIKEIVSQGQATVNQAALDGMSGLSHIILAVGIAWTMSQIYQLEKARTQEIN